jgi:lipopolysaccharide export system permease protein
MGPAIVLYMVYFLALSASRAAIEDGSIPTAVGMWPVHVALLFAGVMMNFMDSVTVRRFRDKLKQRKIRKAA